MSEVKEVYLDLLKKGVQFPPSDGEPETRQEVGGFLRPMEKNIYCSGPFHIDSLAEG